MAAPPHTVSKKAKSRRALRSLTTGVAVPFALSLAIITLFGSGHKYHRLAKPFWFPPLWFVHLATLSSSLSMGLAAWLVWADGGFHGDSDALPLYVAQVSLSIVWHPLVLVMRAYWVAFVFCLAHLGTLYLCYDRFKKVNPFARDLAKPCLAWVAYLTFVTLKLMAL
ncbi:hypothetical protein L6164_012545 [Bauhinia variegata]|uniref:Uncharacterized protein n=1 Tax=Bauhinia variegata TaxID=167791 RepID=A0ACB9P9D5_BAUVA|nr:hypothetical protein L6164_012545 [Bauhinia variegata]